MSLLLSRVLREPSERDHLLSSEPDNGETCGYDGRGIVDRRSIVRACEQSCPVCEPEKPNNNN